MFLEWGKNNTTLIFFIAFCLNLFKYHLLFERQVISIHIDSGWLYKSVNKFLHNQLFRSVSLHLQPLSIIFVLPFFSLVSIWDSSAKKNHIFLSFYVLMLMVSERQGFYPFFSIPSDYIYFWEMHQVVMMNHPHHN